MIATIRKLAQMFVSIITTIGGITGGILTTLQLMGHFKKKGKE